MDEKIKELAARVRGLREVAGLDQATLARKLGVAPEVYRSYESGEADIPVSFLYRAAALLGVEMSVILTGENPRLHVYSVVRRGKGPSVERRKEYRYQALASNFAHKKAEPFLVEVDPDSAEAPIRTTAHPGQEFNYLLEGSLKVTVDGHDIVLGEGDALFFDSGFPHGMKALGGKPARFLAVVL